MAGNIKVYKGINSITKAFPVEYGKKRLGIFTAEKKDDIKDFNAAKSEGLDYALIKTTDYKKMAITIENLSDVVLDMKATIDKKQKEIETEKSRIDTEIQKYQKELQEENELYKAALREDCTQKDEEIKQLKNTIENIGKVNEALQAQNKKRSNQERHLQPKREHSGYVVFESSEIDYKYPYYEEYELSGVDSEGSPQYRKLKNPRKSMDTAKVWMTKIQTPYRVDLDYDAAKYQITKDLLKDSDTDEGRRLLGRCGIEQFVMTGYTDISDKSKNVLFSLKLKKNFIRGYYEVSILHTKELTEVPIDMLKNKNTKLINI